MGTHRLLALSGVVFALLFLIGWFASGGDAPDYRAPDQDWTSWADDNQWKSRIGAFAMLLAGFVFLYFAATVRAVLGRAERSPELARFAFAGAVTGMAGMTMAIVVKQRASSRARAASGIVVMPTMSQPSCWCMSDSAREENRGPLMTTSVPSATTSSADTRAASTATWRPLGQ